MLAGMPSAPDGPPGEDVFSRVRWLASELTKALCSGPRRAEPTNRQAASDRTSLAIVAQHAAAGRLGEWKAASVWAVDRATRIAADGKIRKPVARLIAEIKDRLKEHGHHWRSGRMGSPNAVQKGAAL